MKAITLGLLSALFLSSVQTKADDTASVKELLKTYSQVETVKKEQREAAQKEQKELRSLRSAKRKFSGGKVLTKADEERYQKQLDYHKEKIAKYEKMLKLSKMSSPAQKAELEKMAKKEKALKALVKEKEKPFKEKIQQIKKSQPKSEATFTTSMKKYFRLSKDFPKITRVSVDPKFYGAIIFVNWYDANDKQVLWSHVRVRPKPNTSSMKTLNGKYAISSQSDNSLWLWSGHFQSAFVSSTKEFNNRETLKKAIQALIDLDGLEKITAE